MKHKNRVRVLAAGLSTALIASGAVVLSTTPASAVEATGGSGRFLKQIQWMDFGTAEERIPASGVLKTEHIELGGQDVQLTCQIGPQSGGSLNTYRSGSWSGDVLDDLYNIGGTGTRNSMVNALVTAKDNTTVTFDFECAATVNGEDLPLGGLVFADAEQSAPAEYIAATAPAGARWRIIDRGRTAGCNGSNTASVSATNRLKIAGAATTCATGPSAVAFLDGATKASSVELKGGGRSAIALGVVLTASTSDDATTTPGALHLQQPQWSGGDAISASGTAISGPSFALADMQPLTPRLGASGGASDGVRFPATVTTWPGQRIAAPVTCSTDGQVVSAWADLDHDGRLSDDEKATATCAGDAAEIGWDVPEEIQTGDLQVRVRTASSASSIASPSGVALDGEVESYSVPVVRPEPSAVADSTTTEQNTPVTLDVLANDVPSAVAGGAFDADSFTLLDADGDPADEVSAAGGRAVIEDGKVVVTPSAGFSGAIGPMHYRVTDSTGQSATAQFTVTVTAVAPSTVADEATIRQGATTDVDVLANDAAGNARTPLDPDSLRLVRNGAPVESLTVPGQGAYSSVGGKIRFTPVASFVGSATPVEYSIADVDGTRATGTVTVTVNAVTPVAEADAAEVRQGGTVTVDVLDNDQPGDADVPLDADTLALVGEGEIADTGVFSVEDGKVVFTGAKSFTGPASIDYTIRDTNGTPATGTVTVTVNAVTPVAVPDAVATEQSDAVTVAVLGNDLAGHADVPLDPTSVQLLGDGSAASAVEVPDVGTWTVDGASVRFTPVATFSGPASIAYRVADSNGTTTEAQVTVTVTPVVPVAEPDEVDTDQGSPILVDVLDNDRAGREATPILPESLGLVTADASDLDQQVVEGEGTWTVTAEHRVRFAPEVGFVGTATTTYSVEDANGTRVSAPVHVQVTAADLGLRPDAVRGQQAHELVVRPLDNDGPPRGGALAPETLRLLEPEGASAELSDDSRTLTVSGEGRWTVDSARAEITFVPEDGFHGAATPIRYGVDNEHGVSAEAAITATLAATPPVLAFTGATLPLGAAVFALLAVIGGLVLRRRRA